MISGIFSKIIPHKINNSDGTIDNNNDFRKLFSFQLSTRFKDVSLVSFSLLVNNNTFIPNAFTLSSVRISLSWQYFHFEVLL